MDVVQGPDRADSAMRWRRGSPVPVPAGAVVRRDVDLRGFDAVLERRGLTPLAGVDEAGRGACAGPLVVAAVVLPPGRRGDVPGLADSKLLTAAQRESVYAEIVRRASAWHVVVLSVAELDRLGLHVGNVAGMRRAVAGLAVRPRYVLTDGFPVPGLGAPSLAVWKGDQVSASVAAASVLAKVTRDRLMVELDARWPGYGFAVHKGYVVAAHRERLAALGPCPEHRRSFVTVRRAEASAGGARADLAVVRQRTGDAGCPDAVTDLLADELRAPGMDAGGTDALRQAGVAPGGRVVASRDRAAASGFVAAHNGGTPDAAGVPA